jgi:hypothetical protein
MSGQALLKTVYSPKRPNRQNFGGERRLEFQQAGLPTLHIRPMCGGVTMFDFSC